MLIDPQRSTTDWTEETELQFSGSPICLQCVMFDAVAFSRWSVPQVTTQSWWVKVPALTATYTLRPGSSLPPTHSWKWAVIKYSHTHAHTTQDCHKYAVMHGLSWLPGWWWRWGGRPALVKSWWRGVTFDKNLSCLIIDMVNCWDD